MWINLSIIALFAVKGQAKDAAVLIGGYIMEDFNHDLSVDVYTNHLSDVEKVCQQTGNPPTVPDLPFGTSGHSGVFLPDSGIYICGWFGNLTQQSSSCWKYDARISKQWIEIDVDTDGIQHAAIIEGTSSMLSDSNSFWMMGGLNYENQVLKETMYLDLSSSSNGFQPGINLPKHVYGHCAINTKFPLTGSDSFEAAIIMGGYEGDDRINVKSSNKAYAFCQADEKINAAVCNDTKIGHSEWGSFPDMKSSLYGFKGFGHTYCTQFDNEDLCDGICLMATGSFAKMSEYFPLSRCAKTGNDCEWMDSIGGNPLNITRLNFQHGIGGMTNLNNVPVLFLPMHDGSGNQWMEVLEFQHEDEIGNSVDQWVLREVLSSHRESFLTLSVPIDFLCSEPDPTTSTQKTTKTQTSSEPDPTTSTQKTTKTQTASTQSSTTENNALRTFSTLSTFISVINAFLLICLNSI